MSKDAQPDPEPRAGKPRVKLKPVKEMRRFLRSDTPELDGTRTMFTDWAAI